jgi:biotin transport system substrate-specific component
MNYTDIIHSQDSVHNRYANIALVVGASWLIALSAQITFLIPFSPVPVTGQTLVVLLCGLIMGKKLAASAVGAYLLQGAAGLPFFAGGKSGFAALVGPTGGYLFGFLAAAYVVGMLSELRHRRSPSQAATALLLGNMIIYLFGLAWLVRFTGEAQVLQLGFYPFVVGDALKLTLAIVVVSGGTWLTNRLHIHSEAN